MSFQSRSTTTHFFLLEPKRVARLIRVAESRLHQQLICSVAGGPGPLLAFSESL